MIKHDILKETVHGHLEIGDLMRVVAAEVKRMLPNSTDWQLYCVVRSIELRLSATTADDLTQANKSIESAQVIKRMAPPSVAPKRPEEWSSMPEPIRPRDVPPL